MKIIRFLDRNAIQAVRIYFLLIILIFLFVINSIGQTPEIITTKNYESTLNSIQTVNQTQKGKKKKSEIVNNHTATFEIKDGYFVCEALTGSPFTITRDATDHFPLYNSYFRTLTLRGSDNIKYKCEFFVGLGEEIMFITTWTDVSKPVKNWTIWNFKKLPTEIL